MSFKKKNPKHRKENTKKESNKKDRAITAISITLIIVGLAVFLYPTISSYFAKKNQASVIDTYEEEVSTLDEEMLADEMDKAIAYNESLSGEPVHDPFIEGSGYGLPDNYTEILNISGDGVMAYLEIPKISLYLPIYHGTSDEVLEKGIGHIETTSLPVGGTSTHCVLSGHTGLPNAELFTRIDELEVGDNIYIQVLNETLAYKVYETKVILPEDITELQITSGKDWVTLVTCTPYGINTHRLLVKAERIEYVESEFIEEQETMEQEKEANRKNYIILALIATFIIDIVIVVIYVKKKQ